MAAKRQVATLEGHVQVVTDADIPPGGRPPGLPLLGRRPAALGSCDGTAAAAVAPHGRRPSSIQRRRPVAGGRTARRAGRAAGSDAEPRIPHPGQRPGCRPRGYNRGDISPDGRLLAVGMDEGARLWDLRSGRELAALPAGTIYVFFDGQGGDGGPDTRNGPHAGAPDLRSGRSAALAVHGRRSGGPAAAPRPAAATVPAAPGLVCTQPGRPHAGGGDARGGPNRILDLETGTVRRELGIHPQGEVRALSGDGRWAASSGWHSDRVRLWNAGTGQMVHEWVVGKRDGRLLHPRQPRPDHLPGRRVQLLGRGDLAADPPAPPGCRPLPRSRGVLPGRQAHGPGDGPGRHSPQGGGHRPDRGQARGPARRPGHLAGLHARRHPAGGGGQLRQCDPHLGPAGDPNAAEGHEPGLGLARVSARRDRGSGRRARDDRGPPRRPGQARPDTRAEGAAGHRALPPCKSKRSRTRRRPATTWPGLI